MKKQLQTSLILFLSATIISIYLFQSTQAKETIIFFPIDPTLYFEHTSTHLLPSQSSKDTYSVQWNVASTLNEPAYLRQDISLLYKNGQLEAVLNKWKQHHPTVTQKKKLKEQDSARYDALSFHYAEVHRNENTYTSVQQMSKARLYVVTTPSFEAFQTPLSDIQKQWKSSLDHYTTSKTEAALNKAMHYFHLNKEHYQIISLTDLPVKANTIFRAFPKAKQEEIIGKLWEGIYKNYLLGIKLEDGTLVQPEGSSIPQLLVANNHRELLLLFTLKDGTPIMLRQQI